MLLIIFTFLCFCTLFFVVLCLAFPMLPVSLDCPFLIAHSVSSNACYVIVFKSIKVGMVNN